MVTMALAEILKTLRDQLVLSQDTQIKIALSAGWIFLVWVLNYGTRRWFNQRREKTPDIFYKKRIAGYALSFLLLILLINTWFGGFGSLVTYLGLLSAGLAIALKDPLTNLAGWIFIVTRRPFNVGDRIEINKVTGDVIDIKLFQLTILETGAWLHANQATGRIVHIPNGSVFLYPQHNYTQGFRFIWHEIPVVITFESDYLSARKIVTDAAESVAEKYSKIAHAEIEKAKQTYLLSFQTLDSTVFLDVVDNGVRLTARFLVPPVEVRNATQEFWEVVLAKFSKARKIELAYPTTRFFQPD
jgi:small-conductance mechanosensitive channel